MRRLVGVVVFFVVLLTASVASPGASAVTSDERTAELRLLRLANRFRADFGKHPLTEHRVMSREAREHSDDMADDEEVSRHGYIDRIDAIEDSDRGIRWPKICELVTRARAFRDPIKAARIAFDHFASTRGGRRCLLDRDFTSQRAGVGFDRDGNFWYATLILAHDRT